MARQPQLYLDNNATAPLRPEAAAAMQEAMGAAAHAVNLTQLQSAVTSAAGDAPDVVGEGENLLLGLLVSQDILLAQ